jgi:hypothetical protein
MTAGSRKVFHTVEKSFPWYGKIPGGFSRAWKKRAKFSMVWKKVFHSVEKSEAEMKRSRMWSIAVLAAWGLAGAAWGTPVIGHEPIQVAEKGKPLGVRATVRDAAARVESAALFYAASRGMTPFRVAMTSSGAGTWMATIPGHMIGPGDTLLYYLQAENADGESQETEWYKVKVVDAGVAPAAIPAASDVARQAQQTAVPAGAVSAPATAPAPQKPARSKYLVPAAVIVGGAVAVGGAFAIAEYNSGGGGGGGGSGTVADGNFGGNYSFCFEPDPGGTNATTTVCDSGLGNIYVRGGSVEIVGLWGAEVLTAPLNGRSFTATRTMSETAKFPRSALTVAGEFNQDGARRRSAGRRATI